MFLTHSALSMTSRSLYHDIYYFHILAAFVTKLASGLLFFLPFPYICGGLFITLHYSTLPCGSLFITLHYSTLLGAFFLTLLYMSALYGARWCSLCHTAFVASS